MANFNVMLAQSMTATNDTINQLSDGSWFFDLKIDGVRCVAALNNGAVTLTNRNGVNISGRYPEICLALIEKFGTDTRLILDGEVCVFEAGKPSFKLTSKRDRQQKPAVIAALSQSMPATFVAFDVLYTDEGDIRDEQWWKRKEALDQLMSFYPTHDRIQPNVGSDDGLKMLNFVRQHSLEGLVAKRKNSKYQAGRRSDWVKIKPTQTISAVVVGATAGTGARGATFGALSLALLDETHGVYQSVGEVGTGFKDRDLQEICDEYLVGGGTHFPAVSKQFVVEVEFQEFTVDGALRFPVFRGIRTDIAPEDCTLSQVQPQVIEEVPSLT